MAGLGRSVSNIIAALLVLFAGFCFQGHLTSRFTPELSQQIAASIHPLNQKVFSFLNVTDEQLNYLFAGVNLINILTLLPGGIRKGGFLVNHVFYSIGMFSNQKIGESVTAHMILVSMCLLGFLLR